MPDKEPKVVKAEMDKKMQDEAVKIAQEAIDRSRKPEDVPRYIKEYFDKEFKPSWHCISGKKFCSYITHEQDGFIYFSIDGQDYLLFKTPSI
ncbi:unnamed protein product [Calicophoron daubneyi]|uniref:Dynein light chain n=1 Tax=Calicophoron daubneyi TaxID=300641 RepID=A0AAV2TN11_CALDB